MPKPPKLDEATEEIAKRLLSSPPKSHDDMKPKADNKKKRGGPKDRAASAKPLRA